MRLKLNDKVMFRHAARGSKLQIGTVIEIVKTGKEKTYVIKSNKNSRLYPSLTPEDKYIGQIIKKIS